MLKKFIIGMEIVGPADATEEDAIDFLQHLKSETDVPDRLNAFSFGSIGIEDEENITVDEWNGGEKIEKEAEK